MKRNLKSYIERLHNLIHQAFGEAGEPARKALSRAPMTEEDYRRFLALTLLERGYDPKAPSSLVMESGSAAIIAMDSLPVDSAASVA